MSTLITFLVILDVMLAIALFTVAMLRFDTVYARHVRDEDERRTLVKRRWDD